MELYGYKISDAVGLMKFLSENPHNSLSQNFSLYAKKLGKVKGTIRNLYYAVAKRSNLDKDFCNKYCGGKPIKIEDITPFSLEQERELIKSIIISNSKGESVRGAVLKLANGDSKLALRYQNKYRNALKYKQALVKEIKGELALAGIKVKENNHSKQVVNKFQYLRLKKEIDGLVERISLDLSEENVRLKQKVCMLETENYRLKKQLEGSNAKRYLKKLV